VSAVEAGGPPAGAVANGLLEDEELNSMAVAVWISIN